MGDLHWWGLAEDAPAGLALANPVEIPAGFCMTLSFSQFSQA
jgi:hypothetical protein